MGDPNNNSGFTCVGAGSSKKKMLAKDTWGAAEWENQEFMEFGPWGMGCWRPKTNIA